MSGSSSARHTQDGCSSGRSSSSQFSSLSDSSRRDLNGLQAIGSWLYDITNKEAAENASVAELVNAESFNTAINTDSFFDPPLDEQLWTPLQKKYRIKTQVQSDRPSTPTPVREVVGPAPEPAKDTTAQEQPDVPNLYRTGHAWRAIKPEPPMIRSQTPTQQSLPLEFSSKQDYSPSSSNQPPSPVICKGPERRRLEALLKGHKASNTSSVDTAQRLLQGFDDTVEASSTELAKASLSLLSRAASKVSVSVPGEIDAARIVRPQAPIPTLAHHWIHAAAQEDLSSSSMATKRSTSAYKEVDPANTIRPQAPKPPSVGHWGADS
ncbi:hypothetical protein BD289DRAFT_480756 [Coniella lustricola]|uniref:Uncharacterized protein n=1 Tax=Coniella lustricola TaxID=2025994 RepID=A0A2T3AEJ2_9PEZI|nr:hypothetical protein BD289DRAFT_480756 [Coniella lustricola]